LDIIETLSGVQFTTVRQVGYFRRLTLWQESKPAKIRTYKKLANNNYRTIRKQALPSAIQEYFYSFIRTKGRQRNRTFLKISPLQVTSRNSPI